MNKKIFGGIAVIAITAVVALNINFSSARSNLDISLANVEALAGGEKDGRCCHDPGDTCYVHQTGQTIANMDEC